MKSRQLSPAILFFVTCIATVAGIAAEGKKASHSAGGDHGSVRLIHITGAWTRQTPPNARVGAGYLKITNKGKMPDILLGGQAKFAKRVEVHEMSASDGVMKMRKMENGIVIDPGQTVELKPGGYHLMFMGLNTGLIEGENLELQLMFEHAGHINVELPVAGLGAKKPEQGENSDESHKH